MTLQIRAATADDTPQVLAFIRALAAYERLLDHVKATENDIRQALFGPSPKVFCEIVFWNGAPAGFALWYYTFSTFVGRHGLFLEDLYVEPEYRGHGLGKALLAHLARRCVDEGLGRFEWEVLDWNQPSIDFYVSQGAELMSGWKPCRVSGDALVQLAAAAP
ncbi:GNAT family N-acetyltransferase [Mongoliimonas terrestris]|uniref:GNAT family N-acetyltransferase n=1 Tax=Mongoliimonas terrestris TaxID=1709001 RepID=UPI0009498F08|nr:GNAT family N-acetyltransferase [Mongoliimonas terrestris]